MIEFINEYQIFKLDTKNTTYAFKIVHDDFSVHLYYGKRNDDAERLNALYSESPVSFAPYNRQIGVNFSLDTVATELSFFDSGDLKDTAVKIQNENGDCVTLFKYRGYEILDGAVKLGQLPNSFGADKTLCVKYEDIVSGCFLYSYYSIFYESDTIARFNKVVSTGKKAVIKKIASGQLDFGKADFTFLSICGSYYNEGHILEYPVHIGKQGVYSNSGHTSHKFNPFCMLKSPCATETNGDVYGIELVYSGDFEIQAEKTISGFIRLMAGINHETFSWELEDYFYTPEMILTYSDRGVGQVSRNLHNHLRNHLINPEFVVKKRPVVVNTWEASYFDIDEEKLFQFAEIAKKIGIDTLVVDDGWFGKRNDDTSSLGDWRVNKTKFKSGLRAFSRKVHDLGMNLGIWIEPEMISENSELYRLHPEFVLKAKDRECSLGRHQMVLDLCNPKAIEYVVHELTETLADVRLEYIKWDFNRSLSEVGSCVLPDGKQNETKHRFILGVYEMHKKLTEAFRGVLFEGCSGGGGRVDAGILSFCPQIWVSDNTDPVERVRIQNAMSLAYPLSAVSCHVSNTVLNAMEKGTDYGLRFNVAAGGVLGYELNLLQLTGKTKEEIAKQIKKYNAISPLILTGDLYRVDGLDCGQSAFYILSKEKDVACVYYYNVGQSKRNVTLANILPNWKFLDFETGKSVNLDEIDLTAKTNFLHIYQVLSVKNENA